MSVGKAVQTAQMVQTATTAILEHLCNYKLVLLVSQHLSSCAWNFDDNYVMIMMIVDYR